MNLGAVIAHGSTSVILRLSLYHATTGQGLTGLTHNSTGLIISSIADNEASGTAESVAGTDDIEDISALGTYAAPTSGKVRFKEVDATNFPGLYEFQFADARFAVASATTLHISVTGATNLLDAHYYIPLDSVTLSDINSELGSYGVPTVTQMNARTLPNDEYASDAQADAILEDLTEFADGTTKPQVNVKEINDTTVQGTGQSGDLWR